MTNKELDTGLPIVDLWTAEPHIKLSLAILLAEKILPSNFGRYGEIDIKDGKRTRPVIKFDILPYGKPADGEYNFIRIISPNNNHDPLRFSLWHKSPAKEEEADLSNKSAAEVGREVFEILSTHLQEGDTGVSLGIMPDTGVIRLGLDKPRYIEHGYLETKAAVGMEFRLLPINGKIQGEIAFMVLPQAEVLTYFDEFS